MLMQGEKKKVGSLRKHTLFSRYSVLAQVTGLHFVDTYEILKRYCLCVVAHFICCCVIFLYSRIFSVVNFPNIFKFQLFA